jgi:arabinose-5-phosphate isomerase
MIREYDVTIVISKSGESPEIKVLLPLLKNFGNPLVAITGNLDGHLAKQANYILNTTVKQEACPNNLAPTTSTTAQMVMGDALAIALIYTRGFKPEDFAKYHPGGNLGKRLFLKVEDIYTLENAPKVTLTQTLKEVIVEISSKLLGITAVVNENNETIGVITDGDLRRMLAKTDDLNNILAKDIYTPNPKTIAPSMLALDAMEMMKNYNISQLLVTSENNKYLGVLHIHQLIKEGIL